MELRFNETFPATDSVHRTYSRTVLETMWYTSSKGNVTIQANPNKPLYCFLRALTGDA